MQKWKPKENIFWVGDSITANGGWINNIWQYLLCKYPQSRFNFRNCGTPGDNTRQVINRFEYDVMTKCPEQVIIMLGMNDSGAGMYNKSDAESKEQNDSIVCKYREDITLLINMFERRSVDIVLCTPTPYDDTVMLEKDNCKGRNEVLGRFAQVIKDIGNQKKLITIDFWQEMTEYNHKLQRIYPQFTLCGTDRVHPDAMGHCMMAYIFLKATGHYDENFQNHCPEELFKIIQDKQTIEGKLRNMDMIVRSMHDRGYEKDNFEAFKAEYIKSIEGKPWYEFCIGALELYEAERCSVHTLNQQVEDLIKIANQI